MAINYDKNKERPVVDSVKTGEFLAALRKAAGYTQQEVADYLSITNKTISKWESGAGLPEISILPAVAELYGVTVDELLAGKRLERFVEKEAEQGHVGGKIEKPEKTEARRRWLEESLQERFHRGQVILWGTMLAGYVILVGIYMGFRAVSISAKWIGATWCGVWLLAELVGTYLFWSHYGSDLKKWLQERVDENSITKASSLEKIHCCCMQLIFPFVLAISAVVPLIWIDPFVVPINIPAIMGAGEYLTTARQLFIQLTNLNMGMATSTTWDLAIGGTFITMERLLKALPITLLAGCFVWKEIDLLGRAWKKLRPQQAERHLKKLAVWAVVVFSVLTVTGKGIQALQVVSYVKYTDAQSFEDAIEGYLMVYNNSFQMGQHNGPELEYGVERIDPQYLDSVIFGKERYEKYQGLFAIDYDACKTYQIATWADRLQAKDTSIMVVSALSLLGIIGFYVKCRKERSLELLLEEKNQQEKGV